VVPAFGLLGCATLALAVPAGSLLAGTVVLAFGLLGRLVVVRRRQAR
jgi:hypothetical protein